MFFTIWTTVLFVILLAHDSFQLALSGLSQSPICRLRYGLERNLQVEASILLHDHLWLIVNDTSRNVQIVHQIPLIDIGLNDMAIYLDNSDVKPIEDKWGFVFCTRTLYSKKRLITAFGIHKLDRVHQAQSEDVIVWVFEEGSYVWKLKTGELQDLLFDWPIHGAVLFSLDNSGYLFEVDAKGHWLVRECAIKEDHFATSSHQYYFMIDNAHQLLVLSKIGAHSEHTFLDCSRLSGFIFYNLIYLFCDNSVYVIEDNREFAKTGSEHAFVFEKYSFDQLFFCERPQQDYEEQLNLTHEQFREDDSFLANNLLCALLVIVLVSFYTRSKIIKSKSRGNRIYYCENPH